MTMPTSLERIADALERIADALAPQEPQETPGAATSGPTLTNPLLAWFGARPVAPEPVEDAQEPRTAQTTWEWLGVVGRPAGKPSHCGRCGREGTRRMNHSHACRECVHEAWWDE